MELRIIYTLDAFNLFTTGYNLVRNILQNVVNCGAAFSKTFFDFFKLYVPTIQGLVLPLKLLKNEIGMFS